MKCPYCGTLNNIDSKFCIRCGQSLDSMQVSTEQSFQQLSKLSIGKFRKSNKCAILVLLIVVVVVFLVLYFNNQDMKESTNKDTPNNLEIENNIQQENNSISSVTEGKNIDSNLNDAFLFSIEDVFTITDGDTVVTGSVKRGKLKVGDIVQIVGLNENTLTTEVTGIEKFGEQKVESTIVGDNVAIVLRNITKEQVQKGQVLAKPNSIVAATKFDADVHILSKEEVGKYTSLFDGCSLQFYFRTIDITGVIDLPYNVEIISSGEDVSFTTTLVLNVAMEVGTEFSIIDDGIIVGNGTVTKVY